MEEGKWCGELSCGQFAVESDILGEKSDDFFLRKNWTTKGSQVKMAERVRGGRVRGMSKSN